MKLYWLVCALFFIGASNAIRLDGFRVKHAFSGALRDKENFFNIPRNVKDAQANDYKPVARAIEHGLDVTMMCYQEDPRVCPLYDKNGYIAGLQIAVPFDDLQNLPYVASTKMTVKTILGKDYWTTTSYVVSPDTIKSGGRKGPIDETIESLWIQSGSDLVQIPLSESEVVSKTLYKKQNCIPNMGTHYYYNMTQHLECDAFFPYFLLVKEGRVIGLGWQIIGRTPEHGRDWFEEPPSKAVEITIPTAPSCLQDWASTYGVISLHMYYVEKPWEIRCEDEDSLQPMSVVNKLLLNTSRYATKVVDNVKKIFG